MSMIGITPKTSSSTSIEDVAPFVPMRERQGDYFGAAMFTFNSGKIIGAVRKVLGTKRKQIM